MTSTAAALATKTHAPAFPGAEYYSPEQPAEAGHAVGSEPVQDTWADFPGTEYFGC